MLPFTLKSDVFLYFWDFRQKFLDLYKENGITTMNYQDFCLLNGIDSPDTFTSIENCVMPEGDFVPMFTLVLYSYQGTANVSIDGKDYVMRRKSMSVWRPGQTIRIQPDSKFLYKVLAIGGDLGRELNVSSVFLTLFILDEYPVIRITSTYDEAVSLFFGAMEKVVRFESNPYKKDCLLSLLRAFFYSTGYYIFRSLKFSGHELYKITSGYPMKEDNTVTRFIKLVEEFSQTKRSLSFYAEKLDYNPKYLSALIKRETGYSGQSMIDQYSVLSAMAKLSYGHKSVKEISNEMEFPSQSDFGKFFKRMTGFSPLAYRKTRFNV